MDWLTQAVDFLKIYACATLFRNWDHFFFICALAGSAAIKTGIVLCVCTTFSCCDPAPQTKCICCQLALGRSSSDKQDSAEPSSNHTREKVCVCLCGCKKGDRQIVRGSKRESD